MAILYTPPAEHQAHPTADGPPPQIAAAEVGDVLFTAEPGAFLALTKTGRAKVHAVFMAEQSAGDLIRSALAAYETAFGYPLFGYPFKP